MLVGLKRVNAAIREFVWKGARRNHSRGTWVELCGAVRKRTQDPKEQLRGMITERAYGREGIGWCRRRA